MCLIKALFEDIGKIIQERHLNFWDGGGGEGGVTGYVFCSC